MSAAFVTNPQMNELRRLAASGDEVAQRAAAAHARMLAAPLNSPERRHHRRSFQRLAHTALTSRRTES